MREAAVARTTKETDIAVSLCLDGGDVSVQTGIGFFDHMLTAFAVHGGFGLTVSCKGDLEVDGHHTVEDTGIVLGKALGQALGDKSGIARFGSFFVPMDESLARTVLDISGRPYLVFDCEWKNERVGELDLCMIREFFYAFSYSAGVTLHMALLYGENDHHKAEALFKSFARALNAASRLRTGGVLSTKGILC